MAHMLRRSSNLLTAYRAMTVHATAMDSSEIANRTRHPPTARATADIPMKGSGNDTVGPLAPSITYGSSTGLNPWLHNAAAQGCSGGRSNGEYPSDSTVCAMTSFRPPSPLKNTGARILATTNAQAQQTATTMRHAPQDAREHGSFITVAPFPSPGTGPAAHHALERAKCHHAPSLPDLVRLPNGPVDSRHHGASVYQASATKQSRVTERSQNQFRSGSCCSRSEAVVPAIMSRTRASKHQHPGRQGGPCVGGSPQIARSGLHSAAPRRTPTGWRPSTRRSRPVGGADAKERNKGTANKELHAASGASPAIVESLTDCADLREWRRRNSPSSLCSHN